MRESLEPGQTVRPDPPLGALRSGRSAAGPAGPSQRQGRGASGNPWPRRAPRTASPDAGLPLCRPGEWSMGMAKAGGVQTVSLRLPNARRFFMYVRVVRFTDVSAERLDELLARLDESDGPPPGVPSTGLT